MRQGWRWRAFAGGLLGLALAACSFGEMDAQDAALVPSPPGGYMLGGQTGSLVPDCGVAPLSASGIAVPSGDALAVVYGRGCPEDLVELAINGPDERPVMLTLEALGASVFLVRTDQSLPAGEYELGLGGEQSTVSVAADAAPLPTRLGELEPSTSSLQCPENLDFELTLDPEALAYAPLLRLLVSIDGDEEQLWVDYGALELENPESGRSTLHLPRCAGGTCLDGGSYGLRLRAELAGEALDIEPLAIAFDVPCPEASPPARPRSESCALRTPGVGVLPRDGSGAESGATWWCCLAGALWAARRRRH